METKRVSFINGREEAPSSLARSKELSEKRWEERENGTNLARRPFL